MLLTICIPTYNRANYITVISKFIVQNILSRYQDIELVVVDNNSDVFPANFKETIANERVTLVRRPVHLDSAEENIFRSLSFCSGTYIWFLGDDDPIVLSTFDRLVEDLKRGEVDCFIFNSPTTTRGGKLLLKQPVAMLKPHVTAAASDILKCLGLQFCFAGFSNVVVRRSALSEERALRWFELSIPYSYVAWYVSELATSKAVRFVNAPLVLFRINETDDKWHSLAARKKVPRYFYWSIGMLRLLRRLAETAAIPYSCIPLIMEYGAAGHRYRTIDGILATMHLQCRTFVASGDPQQAVSAEHMEEAIEFLILADPLLMKACSHLRAVNDAVNSAETAEARTAALDAGSGAYYDAVIERAAGGILQNFFRGCAGAYDILEFPLTWCAVLSSKMNEDTLDISYVDPVPDGQNVLIGESYAAVLKQISDISLAKTNSCR